MKCLLRSINGHEIVQYTGTVTNKLKDIEIELRQSDVMDITAGDITE